MLTHAPGGQFLLAPGPECLIRIGWKFVARRSVTVPVDLQYKKKIILVCF